MKKSIDNRKLLLLLTFTLLPLGCAEERAAIDRVQPNALEKSYFDGEFYYGRTVIGVPAGDGFTFVGATDFGGMERISWDIQESFLYARRRIELIRGADALQRDGEHYEGEVVAAFRIQSHFDITYQYNSVTGERINIRYENTSDRPWYERAYIRVDWGQNLVTNYDLDWEAASVESVPYYVQEYDDDTGRVNPDAPIFEPDGSYFDITNRLFARADTIDIPGYGTVPMCWLNGEEFTECGAGEYTIRHSFMRIDPERQYEPLAYKGEETELFGFFWTDRMVYDPVTGIREQSTERYINRHNMWEAWWDEEGGSIPAEDRTLRPIVYHVNREFPDDLREVAQHVGDQWNEAFSDVVEAQGYTLGNNERAFILCPNNPVEQGDSRFCGEAGDSPRLGDIRYSFIAYVPDYMSYGLLGLGPSNIDPETGEIISGAAYVYHHNNLVSHSTVEMLELLNGNRSQRDFIDGVDLEAWIDQVNADDDDPERHSNRFDLEDADYMIEQLTTGWANDYWAAQRQAPTAEDERLQRAIGFREWIEPRLDDLYRRGIFNGELSAPEARLALLRDTPLEEMLLDPEILMAGGHIPGETVLPQHIEQASIARGGFGQLALQRERMRHEFAAARNMFLPEMADDALMGLARRLSDLSSQEAYDVIRETIFTAVISHEVGHTVGLMHNFGGSDDAINYHPEYWEIRDDGRVGHRLNDPITTDEINAQIYDYAYSSVMDYAGRYTLDGAGIGRYDRAAVLFGYAQVMEVFVNRGRAPGDMLVEWFQNDGEILRFGGGGPSTTHYTQFYDWMGELLYEDSNRRLMPVDTFEARYSVAVDEGEIFARVPYIYCSHNRVDLGDSCLTRDAGADPYERMVNILDGLDTWYILRNFPRGRIGVDSYNYVSRYYGRVYNRLKQWHDLYGLYAALLPQYYDSSQLQSFYSNAESGWGGQTWAVQNAFNYLVQTLLMPDIGPYAGPIAHANGNDFYEWGYSPASITLDVTNGRYYSTSWGDGDRDCGYMWWDCLHHVGFYLDKIMAIEALTDSRTNFVARSTPIDLRQWEISYYNTFSPQIAEINRAIMSGDYSTVAPYVDGLGDLRYPNYAGDLSREHDAPIDPFATFSVQLYWQVLGQARFPSNFDRSFVDDSRIFIVGTGEAPDLDPDRIATLEDPISGQTFGALIIRGTDGAGEGMIASASRMLSYSSLCDNTDKTLTGADDCREIPRGAGFFVTPASAEREYRQMIQLFRVMVDISETLDYGDPYNP
jgi:hypothetical protein